MTLPQAEAIADHINAQPSRPKGWHAAPKLGLVPQGDGTHTGQWFAVLEHRRKRVAYLMATREDYQQWLVDSQNGTVLP